jgi:hypothetical protein
VENGEKRKKEKYKDELEFPPWIDINYWLQT